MAPYSSPGLIQVYWSPVIYTFYLFSHTAKVLRLGRLQHGQSQDEEQAASCGGARQEPGDWRPHSHAAGPAPEGHHPGNALTLLGLPANDPPPRPCPQYVHPPPPLPSIPFSSPGTTGFNMSGRVV